ncbi:unnamed protein product [Nesidiocoris tenuis]|uniref:Uncharacterized protein n=1 Tax=Nesidiocoris tenuis TaxID=355587 RepID=A0A6H5HNH9_9HEMI|nr:unnamed protein product [Nesidiocoris tenuis]
MLSEGTATSAVVGGSEIESCCSPESSDGGESRGRQARGQGWWKGGWAGRWDGKDEAEVCPMYDSQIGTFRASSRGMGDPSRAPLVEQRCYDQERSNRKSEPTDFQKTGHEDEPRKKPEFQGNFWRDMLGCVSKSIVDNNAFRIIRKA